MIGAEDRLIHVHECMPDICSLDCGTLNFGDGDNIYISTPPTLRRMAELTREWGVKPELEVFELGHIRFAKADDRRRPDRRSADVPDLSGHSVGRRSDRRYDEGDEGRTCQAMPVGPVSGSRACRCRWRRPRSRWAAMCASVWKTTCFWIAACWPRNGQLVDARRRDHRADGRAGADSARSAQQAEACAGRTLNDVSHTSRSGQSAGFGTCPSASATSVPSTRSIWKSRRASF